VALVGLTLTQVPYNFLSFLGSVYLGRDIRTGAEITLKIGRADHASRLSREYDVYTAIGSGVGISPARWYGKEGQYEVLVLDHLGTSLDDLVSGQLVDSRKVFQYASQMVGIPYTRSVNTKVLLNSLACTALGTRVVTYSALRPL
jgi:hypothetical protein